MANTFPPTWYKNLECCKKEAGNLLISPDSDFSRLSYMFFRALGNIKKVIQTAVLYN